MLEQLYKSRTSYKSYSIDPHIMQLVPIEAVADGKITRSVEYKKMCVEDQNKQFTIDDFSISSILAVGATNMLRPVSMSNHDVESFGNAVDRIGQELDKAINSQNQES